MPDSARKLSALLAATLAFALALPAIAEEWRFYRLGDLKRGPEMFTTGPGVSHTTHVSVCAPKVNFSCLRLEGVATIAAPKGPLPSSWTFEGERYALVEQNFALAPLGVAVEGVLVRTVNAKGETTEFVYSSECGFVAFQWIPDPKEKPHAFMSAQKCAPGANEHCRD